MITPVAQQSQAPWLRLPRNRVALAWTGKGKFVVAGERAIVEYLPSGDPNPAFGQGGRVVLTNLPGPEDAIHALAVDSKERILVAAGSESGSAITLWRFLPDGTPDPSFGGTGAVTTDFGLPVPQPPPEAITKENPPPVFERPVLTVTGMTTDSHDRPVVTGAWGEHEEVCYPGTTYSMIHSAYVARLNVNGSLDHSFAGTGVVSKTGMNLAAAPLARPGEIVYLGMRPIDCIRGNTPAPGLVGLFENGDADPAFGARGVAPFTYEPAFQYTEAPAVAVGPHGRIVVAGPAESGGESTIAVGRFSQGGFPSLGFGTKGAIGLEPTTFVPISPGLAVDGRSRPVVAATLAVGEPVYERESQRSGFLVSRRLADGRSDPGFGQRGRVWTGFPGSAVAEAVLVGSGGKILVAGEVKGKGESGTGFALARYLGGS